MEESHEKEGSIKISIQLQVSFILNLSKIEVRAKPMQVLIDV